MSETVGEQIVFVAGQKMSIGDVRKQFSYLAILTKTAKKILVTLLESQDPLTRAELAQKVNCHEIRVHEILTELINSGLVLRFTQRSRTYYYVLTERGYNIIKNEGIT